MVDRADSTHLHDSSDENTHSSLIRSLIRGLNGDLVDFELPAGLQGSDFAFGHAAFKWASRIRGM